jgi:predicted DNA-binding transcriptional regulator AlpA
MAADTRPEPAALLDADETSAFCGWSRRTTYRLSDAGRMPAPVRVGRMTRWRRAELEDWIARGCPDCGAEGVSSVLGTLTLQEHLASSDDKGRTKLLPKAPRAYGPRVKVFISYCHEDEVWLQRLKVHLKPYERQLKLSVWDDSMMKAGDRWREEIQKANARARVAVLLVSPWFLASEFIAKHELPPLLNAAKKEGLIIMWIPVSFCSYSETEIGEYQAACDPAKPLDGMSTAKRNEALVGICKKIKAAMGWA